MESVLKSQLNQLKTVQRNDPVLPKNTEATFLFDFHTSRKVDMDTIFELGYSGLVELARFDSKFIKYFDTLFSSTSKYFNREVKKEEELKPVDANINELLFELSPYFRHKACHRVLEYLIKCYNVNVYNAKTLFLAFLPCHETKFYLKLIQNINFDHFSGGTLVFFVPFVKNGVVILKEHLYKEISSNFNLLREVVNYYESLSVRTHIDDSDYFFFLCDVLKHIVKSALRNLDVNTLNIILQFVNKIFKFYKSKVENVDNEDYEEKIIINLCELIVMTYEKVNLAPEYSKAITNELVNKLLNYSKSENTIYAVMKSVFIICEGFNKTKSPVFSNETIKNLDIILGPKTKAAFILNNEDFDLVVLLFAIFNSNNNKDSMDISEESSTHVQLIKSIMKTFKLSDSGTESFVLYLFECLEDNQNMNKDTAVDTLSFINETHSRVFNNVLIDIFTNKENKFNAKFVEKVKEVTRNLNEFYQKALTNEITTDIHMDKDNGINAFNLFLNLNSGNISQVLFSIQKLDDLTFDIHSDEVFAYCIPVLASKFSFMDNEIVLNEILNMKSLKTLLDKFSEFKNDFTEFYFKMLTYHVQIYTSDFKLNLEENILQYCLANCDSLKILIHFLFFSTTPEEVKLELINKNALFLNQISNQKSKKKNQTFDDMLINYLLIQGDEKINANTFFQSLLEVLSNITTKDANVNNKDKLIFYIKQLLISLDAEKLSYAVKILSITNLNSELYEKLANSIIDMISKHKKEIKKDDIFHLTIEFAQILIKRNSFSLMDRLLSETSSQLFLSHLILRKNISESSFYNYLATKLASEKGQEIVLFSSLLCTLTMPEVDSSIILNGVITQAEFGAENFNSIFNSKRGRKAAIANKISTIKEFSMLRDEVANKKNEILVNKKYLTKLIKDKMSKEVFQILNQLYIANLDTSNIENLDCISKIFSLFSANKITNKTLDVLFPSDLINQYKTMIEEFNSEISDTNTTLRDKFTQLMETLLLTYLYLYPNSSKDIINLLHDTHHKFSNNLFQSLFSKDLFNLDEVLGQDLDLIYKTIKLALKSSVSPDHFISSNPDFGYNLLNHLVDNNSILNEPFTLNYIFEIIFKNNNSYFNLNFVLKTLDLLSQANTTNHEENTENTHNTTLMTITNNLLTIISNCTVEVEEKTKLKSAIDKIKSNVFSMIEMFKLASADSSSSLELVHIVNSLFLCLNKLISQFSNIEEERKNVKELIIKSFQTVNDTTSVDSQISQQVKEEIFLTFINAVRNFIELLFTNQGKNLKLEQYEIFYEYIHSFVKFSLTLIDFKDKKVIDHLLINFVSNPIISANAHFMACFFANLFYYNFVVSVGRDRNKPYGGLYSDIIFNFFKNDDSVDFVKLSLEIILSIFEKINKCTDLNSSIYFIEKTEEIDPLLVSLNLVNKILTLVENSFFNIETNNPYQILLSICLNIYTCRKNLTKEKHQKDLNTMYQLKELKSFEDKLFSDLNEAGLLSETVLLIYKGQSEYNKQMKIYMLTRYLDIIIINKSDPKLESVFEYLVSHVISVKGKEENVEILQLIFAILTKILNNQNSNVLIYKSLKNKNNLDKIIQLIDLSEDKKEKKNINYSNYLFTQCSILVFLSKVFIYLGNKFLDKFNPFLEAMIKGFDLLIEVKNEELTVLLLETFKTLSMNRSEYYSPYLKQVVFKLLLILDNYKNNVQIKRLINSSVEIISKKQLLDVSLKTVKMCIKNFNKMSESVFEEPLQSLMTFFKFSLNNSDKIMIAGVFDKILKLFIKLLLNDKITNEETTSTILNAFKAFILKINEKQLKQIFSDILKFGKEQGEKDFKYKLEHTIVAFELLNSILQAITIIFVPYFEKYKNYWNDSILYTIAIFSSEDKRDFGIKKSRATFDSAYEDESKFSYIKLNTLLLENIRLNFKNNTDNQMLNETMEDVTESLIGELKFVFFESDEEKLISYFDNQVRPTFVDVFKNIRNEDHFKEFNDMILNLIREDHYLIKLLTLRMIKALFEELKERYLTLITDIVPYITDCIEDSNEKVNIEAFNLMKYIEKTTGEDMKNYLDLDEA